MKTGYFPTGDEPVEHDQRAALPQLAEGPIFASPARAACETAAWLAPAYDIDPAFDDLDYGRWRGLSLRTLSEQEPQNIQAWLTDPHARPHGGESIAMLATRIGQALEKLAADTKTERLIIVTHGIVVKVALAYVSREPLANVLRMDLSPLSSTALKLRPQA